VTTRRPPAIYDYADVLYPGPYVTPRDIRPRAPFYETPTPPPSAGMPRNWRWLPGARWVAVRKAPLVPIVDRVPDTPSREWRPYPGAVPDFTDPATVGCLEALVRELHGQDVYVVPRDGQWAVVRADGTLGVGPDRVSAWLDAL
jgi:hypothetical protein